ncbi:hypothetical protein SEA_SATIS_116 [Streptomyces phage Satis]|nr:hypothetical protein SEA_SATIS_116 [Streptomyces phage Satis]QBZ72013.1 hypothetical protein SEA_KRADAL_115 [Streptomyces phage Kradal]QPL14433.1 hypothetical protein SEA_EHYELIMAYOE_116 [Streptomyces phage EhyElimayoE]
MSYTATVTGFLTIEPPLKWSEIRESRFLLENQADGSRDTDVVLDLDREEVETEEGVSTIITCSMAVPCRRAFDCRNLDEDTGLFVEEMKKLGRTVRGEMVAQPRDYGDGGIWRVVVDEEGARKEMAKLQWPDGSEVQLP